MILGRNRELRRIDELLEQARAGTSGVVLVRGEPGVGKSTLLAYAQERSEGMLVLSARGIESDSELAFAGLHALLHPLLDRLDQLPEQQAAALASALALGPPATTDRFAVAAATFNLLVTAAGEQPLLLLVDDLPWLDSASAEALRVALRQLGGVPVAALLGARDGEASALDSVGMPELVLSGLGTDDALALLPDLDPDVVERLVEETGGNPLALLEVGAMLSDGQAAGLEPLPAPLPAGATVARAFRRRLAGLPLETARALVVAAASHREGADILWQALAAVGLGEAALTAAEDAGVIALQQGRLLWRHPLLRAAAYHGASPSERRLAHRALAQACPDDALADRAWHLAAAATRPSEAVAAELERAALDARRRGGLDAAASAFERAAALSEEGESRARRLLQAAEDLHVAGRFERARSLLDEAAKTARDPVLAADVGLLRGVIEMWTGDADQAVALLLAETERVELLDPGRAARLLVEAGLALQMSGRVPSVLALARRASALASVTGGLEARRGADVLLSAVVLAGEAPPPDVLRTELRKRAASVDSREEAMHVNVVILHMLVWVEEHDLARQIFKRELDAARACGALGLLPFLDACLCELEFRAGRFEAARSAGRASVRVAKEVEQLNVLAFSLVSLARVEAVLGDEAECREHVASAMELARALGAGSIEVYGLSVLGLLELGLGNVEEAAALLGRLATLVDELGLREPGVVHWRADFVEAQALSGETGSALEALAVLEEEARRTGRGWAIGAAARCRGMLADGPFEDAFEQALQAHVAFPFEQARSQLRLGERLRRSRRPAEARVPLRAALQAFELLGAAPWARRARTELRAAGGRGGRSRVPVVTGLTPQELEVALLATRGATNREVATALFLSPKTIEFHLGNVYRKLNVRSRAELTRLLAQDALGEQSPVVLDSLGA